MPGETGSAQLAPPIWLGERGSAILKSKRTAIKFNLRRHTAGAVPGVSTSCVSAFGTARNVSRLVGRCRLTLSNPS